MNDDAYHARRNLLLKVVRSYGTIGCGDAAFDLGWSSHETCAKLRSLRADGLVGYYDGEWHFVEEPDATAA